MEVGDAIMARILAEPHEDHHRLAFADWLDENEGGDRAEFIRVQVALARTELNARNHRDTADLRHRERHLIQESGYGWCDLPGYKTDGGKKDGTTVAVRYSGRSGVPWQDVGLTFRRGFVDEIRLSAAALLGRPWVANSACPACDGKGTTPGLARAIFAAHPVTRVVLTDRGPYRGPLAHPDVATLMLSRVCVAVCRERAGLPPLDATA